MPWHYQGTNPGSWQLSGVLESHCSLTCKIAQVLAYLQTQLKSQNHPPVVHCNAAMLHAILIQKRITSDVQACIYSVSQKK